MSTQIDVARVQQYKQNIIMLSQQRGSRLAPTVRVDADIVGKRCFFDRIGSTEAQLMTSRHADTPLMNTSHSRRSAVMKDYNWADLVDNVDKLKLINDPTSPYAINAMWAFGRQKDDTIITALGGTAETGEAGAGSQALPSGQKIANGSADLTLAKLIEAKTKLMAAEVDEMVPLFLVVGSEQIAALLNDSTLTSSDFNVVKALVKGDIDTFMGFKFIRSERLSVTSSIRLCYAYAQTAVGLGLPSDISVDIGPRRDKNNSMQVYVEMSLGAVRLEDEQVVEIACDESA